MQCFGFPEVAMRQSDMKWEICDYLKTQPQAAGVFYYFLREQVRALSHPQNTV